MGRKARERKLRRTRPPTGVDRDDLLKALSRGQRQVPPVDDEAFSDADALLAAVIDRYLTSHEFNGLAVGPSDGPHETALALLRDGLVELVSSNDWMNTHIRPWPKDDADRQARDLAAATKGELSGCLYPTQKAMTAYGPALSHKQPFRDRLMMGHGTLELAFFDLAAIDGYVQDPQFEFTPGDDGFRFATSPRVADGTDPDDYLSIEAAYAYDHTVDYRGDDPIRRYWCAFLHDLASLPSAHQVRLSSYETDGVDLLPHPEWWDRNIGGRWTDTIGPFTKILWEMKAINDLWQVAFGTTLFGTTDRPRDWGWLLRPTTGAWNQFIHLTDKLLSDNLRAKGLDAAGAPKIDAEGKPMTGTLTRLQELLVARSSHHDRDSVRFVLEPLREVRKARQAPAHKISDTASDSNVVNRQRDLVRHIADALHGVRVFVQTHPKVRAADWKPPDCIDNWRWL
ncbi:MAG: hypothetical protein JWN84_2343 [Nocardioides sp.]|nr:hypothetical protein [Nocardioides sp.]